MWNYVLYNLSQRRQTNSIRCHSLTPGLLERQINQMVERHATAPEGRHGVEANGVKFFSLQILVAQVVLIENPLDDIASPLGISSNMLIKEAITKISFLEFAPQLNMLATKERCLYPCFHGQRIRLDHV